MQILDYFHAQLEDYIDFDFLDQLASPKLKKDGNYYGTYVAEIQPEYATLAPDRCSIVLKEISPSLCDIYHKISTVWSPYIETVYGVLSENGACLAFNEFIRKPSCLRYPTEELAEYRSLSLEDFILKIRCFTEKEALMFLLQLCDALKVISDLQLVHGDVSPQNILLTDKPDTDPGQSKYTRHRKHKKPATLSEGSDSRSIELYHKVSVKLIDFDIAREEKGPHHLVTTVAGTNPYAAPEILDYQTPTDRVDIYSLGCVLAFMLTGKSPKQMSREELQQHCRKPIRKIIAKCTADYSRRYRTVAHLKKDASALLSTSAIPVPNFPHIPVDSKATEIGEILRKQQILESIKSPARTSDSEPEAESDSEIMSSQYGKNILHICHTILSRQKKHGKRGIFGTIAILITVLLIADSGRVWLQNETASSHTQELSAETTNTGTDDTEAGNTETGDTETASSSDVEDWNLPQTTVLRAESAMKENDYDLAEEILDSEKEKNTNTFAGSLTYSEVYNAQGRYDDAAEVVLNFIDNYYPTVNMHPNAPLYQQLKNITGTLSPDVQTRYDQCITECEESGEVYDSIYALIKADRFQAALELCNTRKKDGAFDSALFEYYVDCYKGLEKYEEFADYMIGILENYPPDDSRKQLEVPLKSWVISCMEEIYPQLSPETQKKIDDLQILSSETDNTDTETADSTSNDTD